MKKLAILTLSWTSLFGDVYYNAIVDRYFSPYIGADDLISAHYGLERFQDWLVPPPCEPKRGFWAGTERFAELFFVWDSINCVAVTTQHEVFGHGYQLRSMHKDSFRVRGYKINIPPPYDSGGGHTAFTYDDAKVTTFQELAVTYGGVEATAILANRLKLNWLQKGFIDARESTFYIGSEQDISGYAWISSARDEGDISRYVRELNKTYPHGHITLSTLKKQALVNLLDPFSFYALYAWWRFVISGKETRIPMMRIGSYNYLPSARLGLTPFGPEFYLDNFLVKDNKPIYFYLRGGNYSKQTYIGFGIEHAYIWNLECLPWGLRLDCWYQPHTAFRNLNYSVEKLNKQGHFTHQPHNPTPGISLTAIGHKKLWSNGALFFQIGGKTIGFLEGETLQPSLIARIGLTIW